MVVVIAMNVLVGLVVALVGVVGVGSTEASAATGSAVVAFCVK